MAYTPPITPALIAAHRARKHPYLSCQTCADYASHRSQVLIRELTVKAEQTGETTTQILDRYMDAVHDRHVTGGSLTDRS